MGSFYRRYFEFYQYAHAVSLSTPSTIRHFLITTTLSIGHSLTTYAIKNFALALSLWVLGPQYRKLIEPALFTHAVITPHFIFHR